MKDTRFAREVLEQSRLLGASTAPLSQGRSCARELEGIILELDEAHRNSSGTRKTVSSLQPFVTGISRFVGVIDTMIQADPTPAALLWGGAKFILQVSTFSVDFITFRTKRAI